MTDEERRPLWERCALHEPYMYAVQQLRRNLLPERVREIGPVNFVEPETVYRCTGRSTRIALEVLERWEKEPREIAVWRGGDPRRVECLADKIRGLAAAAGLQGVDVRVLRPDAGYVAVHGVRDHA